MLYYLKTASGDYAFHNVESNVTDPARQSLILRMIAQARALTEEASSLDRDARYAAFKTQAQSMVVGARLVRDKTEIDLSTATYACAWDGQTPYVITLFGTFPALSQVPATYTDAQGRSVQGLQTIGGIPFAGWPQTDAPPGAPVPRTQAQLDAAAAADAVVARQVAAWQAQREAFLSTTPSLEAMRQWVAANPYPT